MVWSVFAEFGLGAFVSGFGSLNLNLGEWLVLVGALVVLLWHDIRKQQLNSRFASMKPEFRVAVICTMGLAVLVFGMYGIGFNAADFIYSQF